MGLKKKSKNYISDLLPREYGAWAMLFVPVFVSIFVVQKWDNNLILLTISMFFVFLSYYPVKSLVKNLFMRNSKLHKTDYSISFFVFPLATGMIISLPLILKGFYLLIPIGILAFLILILNLILTNLIPKSVVGNLVGVVGLTLSSPVTYYVLTSSIDYRAMTLWLLNFLFFGGTILYINMKIRAKLYTGDKLSITEKYRMGKFTLLYHVFAILIISVLVINHYTPSLVIFTFIPITVHAVIGTFRMTRKIHFKRMGFIFLGHSILFVILMGLSWS